MKLLIGQARAAIIKNNKILLIKEKKEGTWETPGGKVEDSDKNGFEACKREVLEETGYDCEIGRLLVFDFVKSKFGKNNRIFIAVFKVDIKEKKQEPEEDIEDTKWFTKKEIKKLLEDKKADDHDIKVFKMFVKGEIGE